MSGETEDAPSGWTVDTLAYHQRVVDSWRDRIDAERDRRYAEKDHLRDKALDAALAAADEKAEAHNDLIRTNERQSNTFATKEAVDTRFRILESWQSKVSGGLLVLAALGVANFVKLWTG